jgi:hypothetical protein
MPVAFLPNLGDESVETIEDKLCRSIIDNNDP